MLEEDDLEISIWDWGYITVQEKWEYLGVILSLAFLFLVFYVVVSEGS